MSTNEQDHPQNPATEENAELPEGVVDTADGGGQQPEPASQQQEQVTVEDLQAQVASLKEELLRSHADMQNLRRRVERDVENAHKYALEKMVGELVSVVDNLERATAAIDRGNEQLTPVGEGVELTLKGLLDVLRKFNVEQVDPVGQPFDPDKHQAMTMVPNPELAPNTVMEVFQKGYLLNGRLVRPAMVVVSRAQ